MYDEIRATRHRDALQEVIHASTRYTQHRAEDSVRSREERNEEDRVRSLKHNSLVERVNGLSRRMAGTGESVEWRRQLGNIREVIGDFGCALFYLRGCAEDIRRLCPMNDCEVVYHAIQNSSDKTIRQNLKKSAILCTRIYALEQGLPVDLSEYSPRPGLDDSLQAFRDHIGNVNLPNEWCEKFEDDRACLAFAFGLHYLLALSTR